MTEPLSFLPIDQWIAQSQEKVRASEDLRELRDWFCDVLILYGRLLKVAIISTALADFYKRNGVVPLGIIKDLIEQLKETKVGIMHPSSVPESSEPLNYVVGMTDHPKENKKMN